MFRFTEELKDSTESSNAPLFSFFKSWHLALEINLGPVPFSKLPAVFCFIDFPLVIQDLIQDTTLHLVSMPS